MQEKYVLRPEVAAYKRPDGMLIYASHDSGIRREYEWSDDLAKLTKLLESPEGALDLSERLGVPLLDIQSALETLMDDQIVMTANDGRLEPSQLPREKQVTVWNCLAGDRRQAVAAQNLLRHAAVDIVGMGGVGTWVAMNLALAGVGCLRLHDDDRVETSNLTRQALYSFTDVGRPKVVAAQEALQSRVPDLRVEVDNSRLTPEASLDGYRSSSFIVGCGDEPNVAEFSFVLATVAHEFGVPYLTGGGYAGHSGRIGMSCDPRSDKACYFCQYEDYKADEESGMERFAGSGHRLDALVPVVSTIAAHQSFEVLKMITGLGRRHLEGRVGDVDGQDFSVTWTPVPSSPKCRVHG